MEEATGSTRCVCVCGGGGGCKDSCYVSFVCGANVEGRDFEEYNIGFVDSCLLEAVIVAVSRLCADGRGTYQVSV